VPTVDQAFDWLIALSPLALYAAAFALAFFENIFPPFPADLFIGICAFVAAPGESSLGATYAAVVTGNMAGATLTYWLGRRYGAPGLRARLEARGLIGREEQLERMYARYGLVALFIGRLVPGVRGLVPAVAGAFKIKAGRALGVVAMASALWYGVLTVLAYRVGGNWEEYSDDIVALGQWATIIGASVAAIAIGGVIWFFRRKRRDR
jgi:membrane protein DedA with SNARE-associated domain